MMKCVRCRDGEIIAREVEIADTFFTRLCGLMMRASLAEGRGLLLSPSPQIHTCFMRFTIDAVFCDKAGNVLYVKENMKPWRFGKYVRGGYYTLELPGGTLKGGVRVGDALDFTDGNLQGENK